MLTNRIRQLRSLCCLLLLTCTLSLLLFPAEAISHERHTIRVGVLNHTTYANQDKNGVWSGLDIECMIAIAQRAGFNLEFIDSTNDPDFLGGLDAGRYDIIADIVKTPERAQSYLFTDEAIGYTNSTLAVRSSDPRWDYGNIEQIAQMRVGVVASYTNNADFRSWCAGHGIAPRITEYQDIEQLNAALKSGAIDGEVYSAIYNKENAASLRTIMRFVPRSFYYAFRKDDLALKNQIDEGLSQILVNNVDYLTNLKNKYEAAYNVNELPFSAAEKAYIASHPIISVAVLDNDEPYYVQGSKGADTGILPDYYALVAKDTGFHFRYVIYPTMDAAIAAVKDGTVDMLGLFSNGIIASQQHGLILTESYFTVNRILLAKAGKDLSRLNSIAVMNSSLDSLLIQTNREFPNIPLQKYANMQLCFNAVKNDEADAVILGLPSATWLLNQTNTKAYSILPMSGAAFELCGAVRSGNQVLCSILNKRIETTKGNFSGIMARNTLPKDDWKTTLLRVPPIFLVLISGILAALVLGLAWALILLRHRQRERTAILAAQAETEKEKLQIEAIQKSAEDRTKFFANISHDMRTPLNAIMNFIRLAQKADLPPQLQADYLAKAESSSKLMLDLIDDTLTVSKLSGGKLALHPVPCRAIDLIETIASPIREIAEQKHIEFYADSSKIADLTILADRLNIEKIFLNLLTNSVRYTPAGGHIWYTVEQSAATEERICYSATIRDDGIGIGKDFLPRLFEPFAQEKRHGYETVGTGLGLSIVKQLVTLMGGSITVTSKIGEGTTFVVSLCFAQAPAIATGAAPAKAAGSYGSLAGKKLLLCEDNALNREIAIALLNDQKLSVITAENGQLGLEAFQASAADEFAAILMDLRMPVMDGIETTRAIRALPRPDAQTIPIIAMTADAFADDVQNCLQAGMNDHIAKPIDPEILTAALQKNIRP